MSLGRANARAWMIPAKLSVLALTSAGALSWGAVAAEDRMPPNILLIYVDDWGWQDAGFMGSRYYETPNIDALAAESVRFDHAYAAAPNCAPSRAALLSGQYAPRTGVYTVNNPAQGRRDRRRLIPLPNVRELAASVVTLAERLQSAGYGTAHIGKWHLGAGDASGPVAQGFDVNIAGNHTGTPAGGHFSPYDNPDLADGPDGEYLTDRLTDEAIAFIERHRNGPFFVYLAHYAVHTPIQAPDDAIARYAEKSGADGQSHPVYAAMIDRVDAAVGRLIAALDTLGIADETLIVLTSDNGGHGAYTAMPDLRGEKGTIFEGGIRVPLLIRLPGGAGAGRTDATPTNAVDLYPTLLDAVGLKPAAGHVLDGQSLWTLLETGRPPGLRRPLFWHFPAYLRGIRHGQDFRTTPAGAIRDGDFKLIEFFEFGQLELYDLVRDPSESCNLVRHEPAVAYRLYQAMQDWRARTSAPVPVERNPHYDEAHAPRDFVTIEDVARILGEPVRCRGTACGLPLGQQPGRSNNVLKQYKSCKKM